MKTVALLGIATIMQIPLYRTPMVERPIEYHPVEIVQFEAKEKLELISLPDERRAVSSPSKLQSGQSHSTEAVRAAIVKYARLYGVSETSLLRIAKCESNYNPRAVNYNYSVKGTHPSGLFQHVALYWPERAARYGRSGASVFDYDAQADVTAQMFRDGGAGLWECKA